MRNKRFHQRETLDRTLEAAGADRAALLGDGENDVTILEKITSRRLPQPRSDAKWKEATRNDEEFCST